MCLNSQYKRRIIKDPELKPRVVHRGLDGLPDIPDGEPHEVDHLVFMVHGIGWACDMKFRNITEVKILHLVKPLI